MYNRKAVKPQDFFPETISSSSSLKENHYSSVHENKSKAYIGAMRALQEKVTDLESEKADLQEKLTHGELKFSLKKQEFDIKQQEEKQHYEQIEKSLRFRISEFEEKDKETAKINRNLEETVKYLEVKLKFNEDQIGRGQEQASIDKENLRLELECTKKSLNAARKEVEKWKKVLECEKREKALVVEEINQQRKMINALEEELDFLRENKEIHKVKIEESYKHLKSEMIQRGQESVQLIKQLNLKNKTLQKMANELKKQGEYYKMQYVKLSQRHHVGETNLPLKKSRSKSKVFTSNKNYNRNSTPSLRISEYSNSFMYSSMHSEENLIRAITLLENELNLLSEKYRNSQVDNTDLETHRRNLEDLCVNIEKKNQELFELKKRQQENLKVRLSS